MPNPADHPIHPEPLKINTLRVLEIGMAIWVVVLVALVAVPSWHSGQRDWWPWVAVAAIGGGAAGWFYIRRGRGNAAAA
jgi:membrane protease YdiL (CAAX protease family)